ncbi:hypothetical protein [Wenxinia marina]|nr:hypothetical protein [Wenxinia marina]
MSKLHEAWRDQRRVEAEIAALTMGEMTDLSLGRADLMHLARMPEEQIARMHWVADLFGAGRALADDPRMQREVGLTCAGCGQTARCHAAFADPAGMTASEAEVFCPNAPTYRQAGRAV